MAAELLELFFLGAGVGVGVADVVDAGGLVLVVELEVADDVEEEEELEEVDELV